MLQGASITLVWLSALGTAMVGGTFFAFSTFIMPALGAIEKAVGMSAMQSINDIILRSLFMPVFFGTTIASFLLAIIAILRWNGPSSAAILAASVIYVVSMFAVTVFFSAPLNNALAAADPTSGTGSALWLRYLSDWTAWNHVRTLTSIAACVIYIGVLATK